MRRIVVCIAVGCPTHGARPYAGLMSVLAGAKGRLRAEITAARTVRTGEQLVTDAEALAEHVLALPELRPSSTVAAYVSVGHEPGTRPLLVTLLHRGHRVLLPVVRPDRDLDWAQLDDLRTLRPAVLGLLEPPGARLGVEAVSDAEVIVCPGLAADPSGGRLGRGGGYYDRALSRCGAHPLRCLLLHDDEVVESVPRSAHDQPVDVVVTPSRTLRLR